MTRWSTLIDLEYETVHLGELIEQEAPDEAIEAEFDRLSILYFGYTRHELREKIPQAVLSGLEDWYFEEVIDLGQRHGFDFEEKAGREEISTYDDGGYVVSQWIYFAEMLIAKECGFFPTTSDEIAAVKLNRDARRFEEELRRQRQRPRPEDAEREQVFGKPVREIKPGSIVARVTMNREKSTRSVREVRVEVRHRDRRFSHEPPKRS